MFRHASGRCPSRLLLLVLLLPATALLLRPPAVVGQNGGGATPTLHDARLELTLFASDPDIVTPIGIAADGAGRVFVLESHTHLQPPDYPGPAGDRVKLFVDADGDGHPDRISVFAEGIDDGMNLALSPAGDLYVVAAREVWALHDRDGNGVSEARTRILAMVSPERVYDHAGLLGITFSAEGWMYVSRGNTGGAAWRVEGTDGSAVAGYGDGGNIMRSRPDGSRLHEVATGFWNPFDLKFDSRGRLLAADNDPDSRGPNRLVHVVAGGDYGYKSLYGESGIHPYLAWNGELPGTLPYAAALGEAPAGLIAAYLTALPADYRDDMLVTIWEERTIVRVPLRPNGTSVAGDARPLVSGPDGFRPVALGADARGALYITDWVRRAYPNHGRGRVWRLAAKRGVETLQPGSAFAPPLPDPDGEPVRRLLDERSPAAFDEVADALRSPDPFLRHAGAFRLADAALRTQAVEALESADARVRLGALLAVRRGGHPDARAFVRRLLQDPDLDVRKMALIWAGSAGLTSLGPDIDRAILTEPPSPELFEVYLATWQQLSPEFIRAYTAREASYARLLKRVLRPRFLEAFIADEGRPVALRAIAVRHLDELPRQVPLLSRLATAGTPLPLRTEAVRSLAMVSSAESGTALLQILRDPAGPPALRADALVGLARQDVDASAEALGLLDSESPVLRLEAARYLRSVKRSIDMTAALAARTIGAADADRPRTPADWHRATGSGGDPDAGRRVFFSPLSACSHCHTVERRGGDLGPDLTHAGRSKSRRQILDAILDPSAEISPEYQGWFVTMEDGRVYTGRQIDVGERGKADLYVLDGRFITLEGIVDYGPMPQSLMPAGLETNLSVEDVRDLLAFLETTR